MKTTYKSQHLTRVGDNLYRNGQDVYYARLHHQGKSYKKCLDTHDRKTAERKLLDFQKQIESRSNEFPDILFEELAVKWLESIKAGVKESTYQLRVKTLKPLTPFFKDKKLRHIKREQVQQWATARTIQISARTFNIERETLSMMFKFAKEQLNLLETNPVDAIKKRKVISKKIVPPTHAQFSELIKVLYGHDSVTEKVASKKQDALELVQFLAYSGCRIDEARNVLWKDVDFQKNTLLVTGGITGTKNSKQRVIPLFPPLKELLLRMTDEKDLPATSTVFNHYSSKTAINNACKAMGMEEGEYFTHHDFRHFFCTNAIEQDIPDHVIANWLGHSDGGILVKTTYGHLRKGISEDMAKRMTYKA